LKSKRLLRFAPLLNYAATPLARFCVRASLANSSFGIVKSEAPQSKHTNIVGNTQTVGLVQFLEPGKWMLISEGNST
jgi:hypothetical protein